MGGIELVEKTVTKAHADLNDKIFIVAFSTSPDSQIGEYSENIHLISQDVFFKSAPMNFKFLFNFKNFIKKHKIERIYVHLPNPFMHEVLRIFSRFLRNNNVEIVAVYHSDIVNQRFLGKFYDLFFSMSKNIYDRWICSSQKLWDSSTVLMGIDNRKKRIIPFCTEGNFSFRQRNNFQGKLLAVGRLVPYKGFDFLINTINKTKYQLNVIGDGPEYEKLERMAGENIILHRRISDADKKKLFDECDVLIVSSTNRAEAYGMIIVEAFEAGLPVIASNLNSGVTFLVQHEKTGLVFETKNEKMLIQSIERLEKDQELYQHLSLNGRKFFESELSYDQFKEKIKRL